MLSDSHIKIWELIVSEPTAVVPSKHFENIHKIEDLEPDQLLPGIVNNITNFGAFVDIGIKESGLIHISNLADGYVSDVNAHVSLQEQVVVKVLEVDIKRKRIQLKLHKLNA